MQFYQCCAHCLVRWGECADGLNQHKAPCPEGCEEGSRSADELSGSY